MTRIEEIFKHVPIGYTLIDYRERPLLYYKEVCLTPHEAWSLNQGFALNSITKRYIRNHE